MKLTSDHLMRGAWYALEQCGILLRDAVSLHQARAYSSSVALAMFAWEELGRHRILLDFWKKVSDGTAVTADEVKAACDDHVTKQTEGQLSLTYRAATSSSVGRLLKAASSSTNRPTSSEYKAARKTLKAIDDTKAKRTPEDRHKTRIRSLYVDIMETGSWNRPADVSAEEATNAIVDAVNDYTNASDETNRRSRSPEFFAAIDKWGDRPQLATPTPLNPPAANPGAAPAP